MTILGRCYSVSNKAGFKRTKQDITRSDGVVLHYEERVVKPWADSHGRATVTINRKHFPLAHLVAKAFLGVRPSRCDVSHKDGNETNDHASNLEYLSHARNKINSADQINSNNTSGVRGVLYNKCRKSWRGFISVDGKRYSFAAENKLQAIVWRKTMELLYNADRRVA